MKKEIINLKKNREGYMGGFGGRKKKTNMISKIKKNIFVSFKQRCKGFETTIFASDKFRYISFKKNHSSP